MVLDLLHFLQHRCAEQRVVRNLRFAHSTHTHVRRVAQMFVQILIYMCIRDAEKEKLGLNDEIVHKIASSTVKL